MEDKSKGVKDSHNKLSFADLPWEAISHVAQVDKWGKAKYPRGNSKKEHNYTHLWDAAFRHMKTAINKEDLDIESKEEHLAHAAWNILTLLECKLNNKLTDDRL